MDLVDRPRVAGQEAAPDPAREARNILEALRNLAFDAAAPQGERCHTRRHLRRVLKTHFRALEARIDLLAPREPAEPKPEAPRPATTPAT